MIIQQDGKCGICGCALGSGRFTKLCIDHNHKTGTVRGLLCDGCNTGIGFMKESPIRLRLAAEYLEKHSVKDIV
jgi:hypothetical protein